jgi:hypothetical protein
MSSYFILCLSSSFVLISPWSVWILCLAVNLSYYILLSKIFNWFSSEAVSTQVSLPYVTSGLIIVLYIWILLL